MAKESFGGQAWEVLFGKISIFHENGDWVGRQSGNSLQITHWEGISSEEMKADISLTIAAQTTCSFTDSWPGTKTPAGGEKNNLVLRPKSYCF